MVSYFYKERKFFFISQKTVKTLKLRDFFLSSALIYITILKTISMNANIKKTQLYEVIFLQYIFLVYRLKTFQECQQYEDTNSS